MDFEQIECFLMLAREQNFSRAADEMNLSQSSVSKKIKTLEEELHTCLFERGQRKTILTDTGIQFQSFAQKAYGDYEQMLLLLGQRGPEKKYRLRLGVLPITEAYQLNQKFAKFQLKYEDIQLEIQELEQTDILRKVDNGQLAFGFARFSEKLLRDYETIPILKDELVIICGKSHPLGTRKELALTDLRDCEFAMLNTKSEIYQQFMENCHEQRIPIRISHIINRHTVLFNMLGGNRLLSVLPKEMFSVREYPDLVRIPLTDSMETVCGLIFRKGVSLNRQQRKLADLLKSFSCLTE